MHRAHFGMAIDDFLDLRARAVVEFAVHQLIERELHDLPCAVADKACDSEAEHRVDVRHAGQPSEHQRGDHRRVHNEIAAIMQRVRADRERVGALDDVALEQHQRDGRGHRDHDHYNAHAALAQRLRAHQARDRLKGEEQRRA